MKLLFKTLKKRCAKIKMLALVIIAIITISFTPLNASIYVDFGGYIPEGETNYLFEGTVDVISVGDQKYIKLCHVNPIGFDFKIQIFTDNISFSEECCYLRFLDTHLNYIKDVEYYEYTSKTIQTCNFTEDCQYYIGYIGIEESEGYTLTKENVLDNFYIICRDCDLETSEPYYDRSGYVTENFDDYVYLYCNTDYFYPQNMIEGNVFAFDNVDGDISDRLSFYYPSLYFKTATGSNIYKNTHLIGEHSVYIDVTDDSYNEARATIKVIIKDCLPPIVYMDSIYKKEPSSENSATEILEHLNILDNYDDIDELSIEITRNGLLGNETRYGEYPIEVTCTDTSGNSFVQVFTYMVTDLTAPEITGPSTINVDIDDEVTLEELKAKFKVVDSKDGSITNFTFESSYFDTPNTKGTYDYKVTVKDKNNNVSTKTGVINVSDLTAPLIYFGNIYSNYNGKLWQGLDCVIDYLGAQSQDVLVILTDQSTLTYGVNKIKYEVNGVVKEVNVTLVENLYEDLDTTNNLNQTIKKVVGEVIRWFNK